MLLFTNRPLASAVSVNASLGSIRNFASDNGIQVSILALPGAGGQGPAEALAEATRGGRAEYVLNATSRQDFSRRVSLLLSPVFGARRFEFAAPSDGTHTLRVGARGVMLQATATFQVAARAVQIDSLQTNSGQLKAGDQISEPTWVEPTPSERVPIDSVEWTVDGRVTQVTSEPWAFADRSGAAFHAFHSRTSAAIRRRSRTSVVMRVHLARSKNQRLLHPAGLEWSGRSDQAETAKPGIPFRQAPGRGVGSISSGSP